MPNTAPIHAWLSARVLDRAGGFRRAVLAETARRLALDRHPYADRKTERLCSLATILRFAGESVPFYRTWLPSSVDWPDSDAPELLSRLPVVDRARIQAEPARFRAAGVAAAGWDATSGSTGTPLRFPVDRATQVAREVSRRWSDALTGWRPGERIGFLWGARPAPASRFAGARSRVRDWVENQGWAVADEMDPGAWERLHGRWSRRPPSILAGYAGALFHFAGWILANAGEPPPYPRLAVISSAEVLTPEMRRQVESAFGRPVLDRYGSREFGTLGAQCRDSTMLHVNDYDVWLEEEPDTGALLVTYLHNRAMPFLRYRIGDLGRLVNATTCGCGWEGPLLEPVAGRRNDLVWTADGRIVHASAFSRLVHARPGIRSFQVVQDDPQSLRMRLEVDPTILTARKPGLEADLGRLLGPGVQVRVEAVRKISPGPAGKHRVVMSRLPDMHLERPEERDGDPS